MKPTIIAVAGASGSGKTTLSAKLVEYYGEDVLLISSDRYYKDNSHLGAARASCNFDHPDAIDFERLSEDLRRLQSSETIFLPTYDFRTGVRGVAEQPTRPKRIIIVEGILVLHPPVLTALFDVKIYVKTDPDLCLLRRADRDVVERGIELAATFGNYKATVRPMFKQFIEPTKLAADLVVNNNIDDKEFDMSEVIQQIERRRETGLFASQRHKITLFPKASAQAPTASAISFVDERTMTIDA